MVGFRKYKKLRDEITMMQESITETNLKLEKFVETWGRSFFEYDKKELNTPSSDARNHRYTDKRHETCEINRIF